MGKNTWKFAKITEEKDKLETLITIYGLQVPDPRLRFPDPEEAVLCVAGQQVLVGVVGQPDNILLVNLENIMISDKIDFYGLKCPHLHNLWSLSNH